MRVPTAGPGADRPRDSTTPPAMRCPLASLAGRLAPLRPDRVTLGIEREARPERAPLRLSSLTLGLGLVAVGADGLQVLQRVSPALCFRQDVINLCRRGDEACAAAGLAQVQVSDESGSAGFRPVPSVAALVAAAAVLMPAGQKLAPIIRLPS